MDLDALKEKSKQVSAPRRKSGATVGSSDSYAELIVRLKESDEKERQSLRKARPLWIIATLIFVVAFLAVIVSDSTPAPSTLLLRGILVILYGVITVSVVWKLKALGKIDYAEPVCTFLGNAEKRFAFGRWEFHAFAVAVTLVLAYVASLYIHVVLRRYLGELDPLAVFAATAVFFMLVFAFGLWATRKDWKKSKRELWLQIKAMKEELERDEPSVLINGSDKPAS